MQTVLNDFDFRIPFLDAIGYGGGELLVRLAEGFRAHEPSDMVVGGRVIEGTHDVNVSDRSRRVEVRFKRPIAWQVIDESFTTWDDSEQRDDTSPLQLLTKSCFLNFVRANHGWYTDTRGEAAHYRICTISDIVDVMSCEPPEVVLLNVGS